MHVYHYAPYETTALKRLVAVHRTHEDVLDQLLRDGVFVDLYATVRGSIRVSQPSYSIKSFEPLYMGAELRTGTSRRATSPSSGSTCCGTPSTREPPERPAASERSCATTTGTTAVHAATA